MKRAFLLAVALVAAGSLTGCSVYKSGYQYEPRPQETRLVLDDDVMMGRVLLAVVGLRRGDSGAGLPPEIEVRMRLENLSGEPLLLETDRLLLMSADLLEFGRPRIEGPEDRKVPAGEARSFRFYFAVPAEEDGLDPANLDGLNLRWAVAFPARERLITVGSNFQRIYYDAVAYYYGWRWGYPYYYCY